MMKVGKTLARVVIGGLFIGHGTQKLFGWFGGSGLERTAQGFESMGMRPGRQQAVLGGGAETLGGAMLALGLLTPLSAAALSGVMVTAIRKVHLANGPWAANGGYEYNLVLLTALALLTEHGPGELSLDSALGLEVSGTGWAIAEAAAGTAGSLLSERLGAALATKTTSEFEPAAATARAA
jgi:putative oxidoreductase